MAGLPCITRLLTGRVATFQTLLFARTLPVVFLHWLFIELEITIVRALILQSENPMNTIPNTLRTVQKQNRAQPHGKNWCGCLKRDLPLTKTLLHKAAVTTAKPGIYSTTSTTVCWYAVLIEFKNNYLREYNSQLSRFVFYLNRHIAASLSE